MFRSHPQPRLSAVLLPSPPSPVPVLQRQSLPPPSRYSLPHLDPARHLRKPANPPACAAAAPRNTPLETSLSRIGRSCAALRSAPAPRIAPAGNRSSPHLSLPARSSRRECY